MAISAYPFESANTTEDQYTLLFRNFAQTGIIGSHADGSFAVTTDGSGLDVQMAAGYAIIRGHAVQNDGPITINIDTADAQFPRIDRIVLRLDPDADGIFAHVIKGTPNANPTLPPLVQTDVDVYDLPIAQVRVPALALNITTADLTGDRQWSGGDVGVWRTDKRPTSPRIGQVGWNVTTPGMEVYNGTAWQSLGGDKKRVVVPHTFTFAGPLAMQNAGDYYIPPFFVNSPAGQTVRFLSARHAIFHGGGEANVRVTVGSTVHTFTVANGAGTFVPTTPTALPSGMGQVSLEIASITGTPKNMSVTVFLEYEV